MNEDIGLVGKVKDHLQNARFMQTFGQSQETKSPSNVATLDFFATVLLFALKERFQRLLLAQDD